HEYSVPSPGVNPSMSAGGRLSGDGMTAGIDGTGGHENHVFGVQISPGNILDVLGRYRGNRLSIPVEHIETELESFNIQQVASDLGIAGELKRQDAEKVFLGILDLVRAGFLHTDSRDFAQELLFDALEVLGLGADIAHENAWLVAGTRGDVGRDR